MELGDSALQPPSSHVLPPGDSLARHSLHIHQLNQRCIIEDANRETLRGGSQGSPEDLESVIQ